MNVIAWLVGIVTQWYVWMPLTALLLYLAWRNTRQIQAIKTIDSVLLALEIPRANDKSELAAEQLFASLHGILRDQKELRLNDGMQEHLSFEIASVGGRIRFYVWVPKALQSFVEGQIYAQYPTVQIHVASEDYVSHERQHSIVHTSEMTLAEQEFLPIKTFQNFEVDPLAGITGTLAKLEDSNDEIWIQMLVRPVADDWHKAAERWVQTVRSGSAFSLFSGGLEAFDMRWFATLFEALWRPPEQGSGGKDSGVKELSERDKTRIAEAEKKATKLGYQAKIRIAVLSDDQTAAKLRMQAIAGTFKQFNSTNLNGFRTTNESFRKEDLARYKARLFADRGYLLNIEEVASVFHLPHTNVETPNIVWASNKTAEPPASLPVLTGNPAVDENISAFGMTNFRGISHQFGMLRSDRSRHVYIIGQTGAGKSGTLELFALSDIFHNQGYAIIDPHGDFAIDNLKFIPASRLNDVVYFNPADTGHPLGFNPLEVTDPNMKTNISSEVIGVLKRMFGESWGPRLEYILRYTILALLDRPETTMLDITRMLTDKKFRKETLAYCTDTVVLQFWNIEFASWNDKFQAEAVAPVLNKVGAFTANPIIRNIIGQPKSTFNIRKIMDEGKILIVNLSKGLIGEDNAGILGAFLVTKIQLAAMSRSDIPDIEDRRPFYLYVDEFQNFATDSFATILSEARKYGLNLTVANQYISQMSETVRNAVFGNVGTMITFRVSADDSPILAKQYEPQFEPNDLLQMHNRNFIINMVINGEKQPAFSARTLNLPPPQTNLLHEIIQHTREHYGRSRQEVEAMIERSIMAQNQSANPPRQQAPAQATQQQPQGPLPPMPGREQTQQQTPTATIAENGPRASIAPTVAPSTSDEQGTAPAKRKRTRTRKKKPSSDTSTESTMPTESAPSPAKHTTESTRNTKPTDSANKPEKGSDKLEIPKAKPASPAKQRKRAKEEDETILRIR